MAKGNFDCPICLDFYAEDTEENFWVSTDCGQNRGMKQGHVFHNKCLVNSVNPHVSEIGSCPICRNRVNLRNITKLCNIDVEPKPDENVFDHEFKIVVLGKYAAGKSCIVKRFARNVFVNEHIETEGVDFFVKSIKIGENRLKLNLWDTAGQERHRSLVKGYVRNAFGIIFVYDIADRSTFAEIKDWVNFANENGPVETRRILVGNKLDLDNQRQVTTIEGEALSRELEFAAFLECSAKESYNIPEIFRSLSVHMLNEERILDAAARLTHNIRLRDECQKLSISERFKLLCC